MRLLHSYFENPDKTAEHDAGGGGAGQWVEAEENGGKGNDKQGHGSVRS